MNEIPKRPKDPDGNGDYETAWLHEHAVAKAAVEALRYLHENDLAGRDYDGQAVQEALRQIEESGWRSET